MGVVCPEFLCTVLDDVHLGAVASAVYGVVQNVSVTCNTIDLVLGVFWLMGFFVQCTIAVTGK